MFFEIYFGLLGMNGTSPSSAPTKANQNGDQHRPALFQSKTSPAVVTSPAPRELFSLDEFNSNSVNDSTPRAKFLKATAEDRHAMHACTLEDLARMLEDADSAATNEHVLKLAVSLARSEVRERLVRAEEIALEAVASATEAKCDADRRLSALRKEQEAVVEALIQAQRDALLSAMEDENEVRQRVVQLEKIVEEAKQKHDVLKLRNEELEKSIEHSAFKMTRLDSVESRATSLELAVREAWDRVRNVEEKLKERDLELSETNLQLLESQSRARCLESELHVATATLNASSEVVSKEKENFQNIITQLRIDLALSRDAVERARAQTDATIAQLATALRDKSSVAQSHAESLKSISSRAFELQALLDSQVAGYIALKTCLIDSDAAALAAESRAFTAGTSLKTVQQQYDELLSSSKHDTALAAEALDLLKQEYTDMKEACRGDHLIALEKEADLKAQLENSVSCCATAALHISQLKSELQESDTANAFLRTALERYQSKLSDVEKANAVFVAMSIDSLKSSAVPAPIPNASESLALSTLVQSLEEFETGGNSEARAIYSDVAEPPSQGDGHLHSARTASSPSADSMSSSPAIPLSSPADASLMHSNVTSPDLPNFSFEAIPSVNTPAAISSLSLADSIRSRFAESKLLSPSSPVISPSNSIKLARASLQSSPRPQPGSEDGSPCPSRDTGHLEQITGDCDVQLTNTERNIDFKDSASDVESGVCTLQGSATSANGSKVTWIYHGNVNSMQLPEGTGTRTFSNGEVYEGMWCAGLRHGVGQTLHADGAL